MRKFLALACVLCLAVGCYAPVPVPVPVPRPMPHPHWQTTEPAGQISVGGPTAPDGKTQVTCDLPVSQRTKNIGGSDGAGLCVFTSIMHAARWENEPVLSDFQKFMSTRPGGGYPDKVTQMIAADAQQKGMPKPAYVQYEGRDPAILDAALKTGRMPGVTYNGRDPHYHQTIAHMVNLVYLDDAQACILDNNFIGDTELVWMSRQEFLQRWTGGRSGWAVIILNPPPPPPPHN